MTSNCKWEILLTEAASETAAGLRWAVDTVLYALVLSMSSTYRAGVIQRTPRVDDPAGDQMRTSIRTTMSEVVPIAADD